MKRTPFLLFGALISSVFAADSAQAQRKNVVMIAGRPSHGPGEHEHNAGILLLKKCLDTFAPQLADTKAYLNGAWPSQQDLDAADTVVMYCDGGGGHVALQGERLKQLTEEVKRGMGVVCLHYGVEVPKDKGGPEFKEWLGGYFETDWSVNPHWFADYKELPTHPITNGVLPFGSQDEWYFHMRFKDGMTGVTPILSAVAPDSTMSRGNGPHSGNPAVRAEVAAKTPQHTAWAVERPDGGRGFGFTGGHFHKGWGNDSQRKLVLNAILWTAKAKVPDAGVDSKLTEEDLKANLDPKGRR